MSAYVSEKMCGVSERERVSDWMMSVLAFWLGIQSVCLWVNHSVIESVSLSRLMSN